MTEHAHSPGPRLTPSPRLACRATMLAALGVLALGGCKDRSTKRASAGPAQPATASTTEPAQALPATPPASRWENERLVVEGHPTWHFGISYTTDGEVFLALDQGAWWPKGTKVTLGEETQPLSSASARFQQAAFVFGSMPVWRPDEAKGELFAPRRLPVTPTASLKVQFANGVEIVTQLPAADAPSSIAKKVMSVAKQKPLVFDGEPPRAATPSAFHFDGERGTSVLGPAKTLSEIDYVIVSELAFSPDPNGTTCSYNVTGQLPLELETATVTIYDRRTHEPIGTKTFGVTKPSCPQYALSKRAILGPPRREIDGWIADLTKIPLPGKKQR